MTAPRCRVVTLNLLANLDRWPERRGLVLAGLAELQADLIALQEVALPDNTAQWLAGELNQLAPRPYTVHLHPKSGSAGLAEGVAILSRLPVERHATLDLGTQNRVSHAVLVRVGGAPLLFANAHLYWLPGESMERVQQVELLLAWLADTAGQADVVVCGDFNGTPETRAIRRMRQVYASAHAVRHGAEPEYTCPTPLMRTGFITRLGSRVLNLLQNRQFRLWRGTLDYIFVSRRIHVQDCAVVLNQPAPHDPTLYPSDHFGLAATLELPGS